MLPAGMAVRLRCTGVATTRRPQCLVWRSGEQVGLGRSESGATKAILLEFGVAGTSTTLTEITVGNENSRQRTVDSEDGDD